MLLSRFLLVSLAVVLLGGLGGSVQAQPDSVRARILEEKGLPPDHSPRGALWRTAAVPGWGQYYNRQYYKIPFVYAGFAALGYRIYRANRQYRLFDRAHLYGIGREREGENPYQQYEAQFNEVKEEVFLGGTVRLSEVRNQRDQFRRKRDLSIVWTGLFYTLTLLDAYVSAHLLTFDVDDDLAVRVRPTGPFGPATARADDALPSGRRLRAERVGVRVQLRF
jgi:hypothetical protein